MNLEVSCSKNNLGIASAMISRCQCVLILCRAKDRAEITDGRDEVQPLHASRVRLTFGISVLCGFIITIIVPDTSVPRLRMNRVHLRRVDVAQLLAQQPGCWLRTSAPVPSLNRCLVLSQLQSSLEFPPQEGFQRLPTVFPLHSSP
ncbi:hypothetical protein TURU_158352 [Turdus rufiventris]|nr:hypothetical protein TURU_158352 [Turdus rufiventris]